LGKIFDFTCWDFGDRNGQIWDSEIGKLFGRTTQMLIIQEMGVEFKPTQKNDFVWFWKTMRQVKWLLEVNHLHQHREWLSDQIRSYATNDDSIDTITGFPGIIYKKMLEDLVVYETDPKANEQYKNDLKTINPEAKEVPLLLRQVCEEKRKISWSEILLAVENDNSGTEENRYGFLN